MQSNPLVGKVTRESRGSVRLYGLDRVARRNAFDSAMLLDLAQALGEYESDPDARCAVLFSHGEHFTSGLDLAEMAPRLAEGGLAFPPGSIDPQGVALPRRRKPLLVAVQGICWTIGVDIALAADIVLAADTARFGCIEVRRGIYPSGGTTVRLPRAAGWSNAMRYLLTGDEFDANEARRLNLVTEVVPPGALLERAITIAERVASASPLGVQATLASSHQALTAGEEAALAALWPRLQPLFGTADVAEALAAMMQKREPHFRGQ